MSYVFMKNVSDEDRKLFEKGIDMCRNAGLPISDIITFGLDSAEKRHGLCRVTYSRLFLCYEYKITISKYLVNEDDKLNTIIHELLHTCPSGHTHGCGWQRLANVIKKTYGIEITRCSNKEHEAKSIASSRRTYFTREEYEANKDLLVAIAVQGSNKPSWFVKKTSKLATHLDQYKSKGRKLVFWSN